MTILLLKEKIIETEKISNGKKGGMMRYISICGGHLSLNYLMQMKLNLGDTDQMSLNESRQKSLQSQ